MNDPTMYLALTGIFVVRAMTPTAAWVCAAFSFAGYGLAKLVA